MTSDIRKRIAKVAYTFYTETKFMLYTNKMDDEQYFENCKYVYSNTSIKDSNFDAIFSELNILFHFPLPSNRRLLSDGVYY